MRPRFDVLCVLIMVACFVCGAFLGFGPTDDTKIATPARLRRTETAAR